ncbi:MAG: class I SAM-dependent methyltransferase, partial [Candidatus Kapaibacterium sp.]
MPKILYGAHKLLSLLPARTVVRALLRLDNFVYLLTGMQARKMENGIHPKHRLMHYHDFFISNIPAQSRVLDIGCGYGALAADVAANVGDVRVYGVDINPDNIRQALINYSHENLKFVEG